ncbi:hypothetical protein V8C86DRAFT_2531059 [Haematococcus lacustris]
MARDTWFVAFREGHACSMLWGLTGYVWLRLFTVYMLLLRHTTSHTMPHDAYHNPGPAYKSPHTPGSNWVAGSGTCRTHLPATKEPGSMTQPPKLPSL